MQGGQRNAGALERFKLRLRNCPGGTPHDLFKEDAVAVTSATGFKFTERNRLRIPSPHSGMIPAVRAADSRETDLLLPISVSALSSAIGTRSFKLERSPRLARRRPHTSLRSDSQQMTHVTRHLLYCSRTHVSLHIVSTNPAPPFSTHSTFPRCLNHPVAQ